MGLLNTIFDKFKAKLDKTDNALISNNPIELLEQSIKKHQMDLDEKKEKFYNFKGRLKAKQKELNSLIEKRNAISSRLAICERNNDQEGLSIGRDKFNEVSLKIEQKTSEIDAERKIIDDIDKALKERQNKINQLISEKDRIKAQYELAKSKNELNEFKKEFDNGVSSSNPYMKNIQEFINKVDAMEEENSSSTEHDLFKGL